MSSHILSILLLAVLLNPANSSPSCFRRRAPRLLTINPPTLFDPLPFGYSHVTIDTLNKVAYIAGQVAIDKTGAIVGETLAEQLPEAESNIKLILDAINADVPDIMKMTVYVRNLNPQSDLQILVPAGNRLGNPPTTLASTPALAIEGLQVEIDLTVAVSQRTIRKLICKTA